jgi:dephospho-CoA kinase
MTFRPLSPSNQRRHIGLYGKSGAGKTTVARYLCERHGYAHVHPGGVCREVTLRLFGSNDKAKLNAVNDALRNIDPDVWVRVSLQEAPQKVPLVIDGLRFRSNLQFLRQLDFDLWKIEAPDETRIGRLEGRGQTFDWSTDAQHFGESELEGCDFAAVITNIGNENELHRAIEEALAAART